jgi:hypothetical protein
MAICLEVDQNGIIHQASNQSLQGCAMVALSGAEYLYVNDPYERFVDGNVLGWGVVFCMAIAFGFRQMRREVR